jgi:hypothetical protein
VSSIIDNDKWFILYGYHRTKKLVVDKSCIIII